MQSGIYQIRNIINDHRYIGEEIKNLYNRDNISSRKLAKQFEVDKTTVLRIIKS